jgi:RES domain-containing protein
VRIARICRAKYPDLDGKGAAKSGGRWNSPGTPIVYASSCGALAVLEYRVHTHVNPDDLLIYTIEIPDALQVERSTWMPEIATSRSFGDAWVKTKRSPILSVPSVVVPHQTNYLINPEHPDIVGSIKIVEQQSFMLDVRLFSALAYP